MENRKIVELDLNDILPNRFQPRIKFNETSITELAESIREHGVIQPIVVRPLGDRYEIIAGERRYKASVLAGKETIQAIITELNDKDSAEVALIENVQRQDLTPIEEAISYKKILDMGYLTQEELAEKLGKTQSTVANKLRLLNLDDEIQEALLETKISERHARSLLKLADKNMQKQMLARIINERLTVRKTDEEISKMMNENNNRKIEIIDFDSANKTTEQVSQEINYNIPTTPIIEDIIQDPVELQSLQEDSTLTNPGFMNIEQIEKTAEDINVAPKPVADMDALLTPSDILNHTPQTNVMSTNPFGISMDMEENDDGSEGTVLRPGKFFNLSDLENDGLSVEEQNTSKVVEQTSLDLNNITPNIVEQPVVQNETRDVISNPNINNFVTNFDQNLMIDERPTPIIPANPEPLIQTPIMEPRSNQTISIPNYNELETSMYGITNSKLDSQNNMEKAIELIRECASKIESLGFEIETEEYDFEDMYQTIFKINKKIK